MAEPKISHLLLSSAAIRQGEAASQRAAQIESQEDLQQYFDRVAFNPMQMMRNFKELNELKSTLIRKEKKETDEVEEFKVLAPEEIEETASRFQKNNYELAAKTLTILRDKINANDSPEEILDKVLSVYPDVALADEALDFLIETADPQTRPAIERAKEQFNATFAREIKAGRNIGIQAREFSEAGLGSTSSLRDLYRDITGTPRDPLVLFNQLTEKFQYEQLKSVLRFLLHSLGSDLRSKGPSLERGELKRLIDETRSLQGILGVFRFFQTRDRLIHRQFASYGLVVPSKLTFQTLARTFIKLLAERYMNPEKILQVAQMLGLEEEVAAQIIVLTQMRDAVRQVSPKYYRNPQHYEDMRKAFLDALETLEEQLEEEKEEENEKKKDKKK